jgi:CRISPR-associated protein Cmr4
MRLKESGQEQHWYGHEAVSGREDGGTTEALVKFEYASLVWFPVFCPGQPVVWISCPRLLKRYKLITGITAEIPKPYSASKGLQSRKPVESSSKKVLFFNLGFITLEHEVDLALWIPGETDLDKEELVVVGDNDIALIHDMGLYRQSRVALESEAKKVKDGAFFNVEALPEGSVLIFPVALKEKGWEPFGSDSNKLVIMTQDLYFGGLESIGFGHCHVTLQGDFL